MQHAADPHECLAAHAPRIRRFVSDGTRTHVLALGKASVSMLNAASDLSDVRWKRVLGTVVPDWRRRSRPLEQMAEAGGLLECDHPLATPRNLLAAANVREFVRGVAPADSLLVLLSGGASAHITLPVEGLELSSLVACTSDLMRRGASIHELNTVRKQLEQLKGGRLGASCSTDRVLVMVLSDVIGDPLDVIGSGPFTADSGTPEAAIDVLRARGMQGRHPEVESVLEHLRSRSLIRGPRCPQIENVVIGNNQRVVDAAAAALSGLGYHIDATHTAQQGTAAEIASLLLHPATGGGRRARVIGGEWVVEVGDAAGKGGPSQELALIAAVRGAGNHGWALLTYSTDGIDGPTTAAGAIVDGETVSRCRSAGCDVDKALVGHDSHTALAAAGVLLNPGPTGTNVNHVAVLVRDS